MYQLWVVNESIQTYHVIIKDTWKWTLETMDRVDCINNGVCIKRILQFWYVHYVFEDPPHCMQRMPTTSVTFDLEKNIYGARFRALTSLSRIAMERFSHNNIVSIGSRSKWDKIMKYSGGGYQLLTPQAPLGTDGLGKGVQFQARLCICFKTMGRWGRWVLNVLCSKSMSSTVHEQQRTDPAAVLYALKYHHGNCPWRPLVVPPGNFQKNTPMFLSSMMRLS